ncbi:MAG: ATP-binding cassette domain-containing protein [Desulfurococcaceae archaeon]
MGAYSSPIISVRNISKSFPGGIKALYKVSLDVYPGEVLALLGENGSGKSTLIKILYGMYVPDEGKILINGREVKISAPRDAIKHGIVLISQIPQLIDNFTGAENILLSLREAGSFTTRKAFLERVKKITSELGIGVDLDLKVHTLTYTQRQLVEVIKAILLDARVLLVDEALTYLPESGRKEFYKFMLDFKSKGNSIILVTHKISEALEVADKLAILRRGVLVDVLSRNDATPEKVRLLMFGVGVNSAHSMVEERGEPAHSGKEVITVKELVVSGDYGEESVRGVTFNVRAGEVIGITGLTGNGQRELVESIMGLRKVLRGKIYIDGFDVTNKGSSTARSMGVGFIPDTPLRYGVALDMSILENTALVLSRNTLLLDLNAVKKTTLKIINDYNIATKNDEVPVKLLSGGNLMKVVIGRELEYAKKALVAYNPTRNLDEYTSSVVRKQIVRKAREEGLAVLYVSEDLDEVMQVSSTVYVMSSGILHGPFETRTVEKSVLEKFMVM